MAFDTYTTLNISSFVSRAKLDGFSRLNRVAVRINPPQALARNFDSGSFTYYAEAVTIPGIELLTNDLNLNGPPMTYPTRTDYRPGTTITFLVDDKMSQRLFFDSWMNYIIPKERGFDVRYRDDYIGKLTIFQLTEDGRDVSYGVELYEAYPTSVGEIRGNWSEQEVARLDINFSYRYWRNLSELELSNDKIRETLLGVTVTGTRDAGTLQSVIVTGTRKTLDDGSLIGVTVTGTRSR